LSDYYVLIHKVVPTPVLYRYECTKLWNAVHVKNDINLWS